MSERDTCGTCRHWHGGQCFRFPPQPALIPSENHWQTTYFPFNWRPDVGAAEPACGEFSQRPFAPQS